MELCEGEVVCSKCNGEGTDDHHIYICDKCEGEGKVDWVRNAVQRPFKMSSLRRLDIRRCFKRLEQIAIDNFPNVELICEKLNSHLETLKNGCFIYDYDVDNSTIKEVVEVLVQPNRTIEYCKLQLKIAKIKLKGE